MPDETPASPPATATHATELRVLIPAEAIARRVDELANEIAAVRMERPILVPVLTGSFVFAADLMRALHRVGIAPEVDFLSLSSYRKSTSPAAKVDILRDLEISVRGRDVLLVDDILDTGRTLAFAKDLIAARGARRLFLEVADDNSPAIRLYRRAAFVETGRRKAYYRHAARPPVDARVLSKSLAVDAQRPPRL